MKAHDTATKPNGDGEATDSEFVVLLTEHQLKIRNFIATLVPAIDQRPDIQQEVNIILWEKRRNFELGTNFRAWAFAVARFVIMSDQKRLRREQRLIFRSDIVDLLADHWESLDTEPDERMEALAKCLERVDDSDRQLLIECYSERGAIRRVSESMGQPAPTIRGILLRLRRQLEQCIYRRLRQQEYKHGN